MHENAMEFGDPYVHAPTQKELKISERVAAYNAGAMDKVSRIDEREEDPHRWKCYHRSVHKYRTGISKATSSKVNSSS